MRRRQIRRAEGLPGCVEPVVRLGDDGPVDEQDKGAPGKAERDEISAKWPMTTAAKMLNVVAPSAATATTSAPGPEYRSASAWVRSVESTPAHHSKARAGGQTRTGPTDTHQMMASHGRDVLLARASGRRGMRGKPDPTARSADTSVTWAGTAIHP